MTKVKRCSRCGETKPLSEFFKNRARGDGVSGYCRICQQVVNAERQQRQRLQVIEALGGPRCARCEFADLRALVVDHRDGGGNQHRRDAVSMWGVYKHALAHPDEYQVLCCNCNQIKRHEDGEWASREYTQRCLSIVRERLTTPPRWARDYDACTECGTTDVKHQGKGLCRNCFMRSWKKALGNKTVKR